MQSVLRVPCFVLEEHPSSVPTSSVLLHSFSTTTVTHIYNTGSAPDSWPHELFYSYLNYAVQSGRKLVVKLCFVYFTHQFLLQHH